MPRKKSKPKTARALAFGPAPVLAEEDHKAYDDLLMQVSSYVKPTNIIEDMWVRDVVDLTWDILRCRRSKKNVIEAAIPRALERLLTPYTNDPVLLAQQRIGRDLERSQVSSDARERVNDWILQEPKAKKLIKDLLATIKLTMADVGAQAFALEINKIQQIDLLMASAEARRNAVLREIESHRAIVAERLRKATQNIIDAEYEMAGPKEIAQEKGAETIERADPVREEDVEPDEPDENAVADEAAEAAE